MQKTYTATVTVSVEETNPQLRETLRQALDTAINIDMATENSENRTEEGNEIMSVEINWETLRPAAKAKL